MQVYFIAVLCLLQLGGLHGEHTTTDSSSPQGSQCSCENVIKVAITNITTQLEEDFAAKFQQQYQELSEVITSQNEQISDKILRQLSNNYERLLSSIENTHFDIGTFQNPATSCRNLPNDSISGQYWIQSPQTGNPTLVYCDMVRECCGNTGQWMQIANLDMTDNTQQCPPNFRALSSPKRLCGTHGRGCVSTTFPVHGVQYSRVCGRILGYQYAKPDAFGQYYRDTSRTINDQYVDGVSLTHGQNPRKHVWTFAAAHDESGSSRNVCPCTKTNTPYTGRVPPFIGQDYFCDSGSQIPAGHRFYLSDPLWDGEGCGPTSTCCELNNPPWFCKQLPQPTTDDIELRLCVDEGLSNEDVTLEQYEILVQ